MSIQTGAESVIEVQIPLALLNDAKMVNIAVVSTNRGRASTASDILGTDLVLGASDDPLVLETFFNIPLAD